MASRILMTLFAALSVLASALAAAAGDDADGNGDSGATTLTDEQKIERLIATVRELKDATFIRNGSEYVCGAAAEHMERKWNAGRKKIKSARDFIRLAASKSSQSGEPYRIRFKDGTEKTSEAFLTAALDELEGKGVGTEDEGEGKGED